MIPNDTPPLSQAIPDQGPEVWDIQPPSVPVKEVSADNPPWGVLSALVTWFLSVLLLLIIPIIPVIPYVVYLAMNNRMPTPDALKTDKTLLFLSVLGVIPAHLLTLLVIWAVVTWFRKYPFWKTSGFSWPPQLGVGKTIALSVVASIALLAIGFLITWAFGGQKTEFEELIESSRHALVTVSFLAIFTAPLVEELVYRGVLYSALQRALGVAAAVTIVSFMFAGVHYIQYRNNLSVVAVITILSVCLTVVRAWTGRLLPSFLIHLIFNSVQTLILLGQTFIPFPEKGAPDPIPTGSTLLHLLKHLI